MKAEEKTIQEEEGGSNKGRGNERGHKQEQDAIIYIRKHITEKFISPYFNQKKKKSYIKKDLV